MKAQGTVKGILFDASDGAEYLLGFAGTRPVPTPILSRRQADGTFSLVEDVSEASKVATRQLGISGSHLIGPGMGKSVFLWTVPADAATDAGRFRVVVWQSVYLSVAGYALGLVGGLGLYEVAKTAARLPIGMTWDRVGFVLALTVGMCVLSGLLAVRKVKTADPADLF